jgi:hypothetical protein
LKSDSQSGTGNREKIWLRSNDASHLQADWFFVFSLRKDVETKVKKVVQSEQLCVPSILIFNSSKVASFFFY